MEDEIKSEYEEMLKRNPMEEISELKTENKLLKKILEQLLKIDLNERYSFF